LPRIALAEAQRRIRRPKLVPLHVDCSGEDDRVERQTQAEIPSPERTAAERPGIVSASEDNMNIGTQR